MTHAPLRIVLIAALAGMLGACAGAQKKKSDGPEKAADRSATGPAEKKTPQQKAEELVSSRSLRLFEDATRAFNEQKQIKVFDWPLLEKKFKAVVEADERFGEAWYNLGVIAEKQQHYDEARKRYRKALEVKPSLKQAAENLAVLLENEGKPGDALAIYQDILRRHPDDGAARARIASLYRDTGDFDRAMKFAREALMREPQNLTAYKVMMRAYLDRNNLNMAKLVALRATKLAADPELFYTMGLIALKEGDEEAAVGKFKQAVQTRDDFLAARVQIASIAARHQDWANAAEQYRKILQYEPKNTAARNDLGVAYKGLGQYDKAMAEYDAAIKNDPHAPAAYFNMGLLFQRQKDAPEKAIEYYKKFVAASRDNVPADHPVFENIREAEQYIRQLAEAKAAEERAKAEAKAAEERAKKEAEEKKRLEEEQKKQAAAKARAEDEAKQAAERERRQKEAKDAVDAAMKAADGKPAAKPAPAPAPAPEAPKAAPPPKPAEAAEPEPKSEAAPAAPRKSAEADEPEDGM